MSDVAVIPTVKECIAANEQSIELRRSKQLRASREQLLVCAAQACPADIRSECARGVIDVTAAIPTVVLSAQDAAGGDLVAVSVTLDGARWLSQLDGTAISLDPGPHRFVLTVEGKAPLERTVILREGEKDRREVIRFPAPAAGTRTRDPVRRTLGLVTGAAGVVGLGVGVVSGIIAASQWSKSQSEYDATCNAGTYNQAVADHNTAQDWANVSTTAFIAGGVVLAVGGVLFFTAPYVMPGKTTGFGLTFGAHL